MKRWLFTGLLLVVVLTVALLYLRKTQYITVKVQRLERGPFEVTVGSTQTGSVKTDLLYHISPERQGKVIRVLFKEGGFVSRGSVMVELDRKDVLLRLSAIKQRIEAKQQEIASMRIMIESLRKTSEQAILKAEAHLKEAEQRWQRYRELYRKGFVSEMKLMEAERAYRVTLASYREAEARTEEVEIKERQLEAQQKLLEALRKEKETVERDLERSYIRSPVDGVVLSRSVQVGDVVSPGRVLAEIAVLDGMYVEAKIDEADIGTVDLGQEVHITMDAYPDRVFRGRIGFISPVVLGKRLEARTFTVRVYFDEPPERIRPGMSADVEIVTARKDDALVVPTQAVVEADSKRFVYRVVDERAVLTEVTIGTYSWRYTEVIRGLHEGDLVIINPDVPGLHHNARVKVMYESS